MVRSVQALRTIGWLIAGLCLIVTLPVTAQSAGGTPPAHGMWRAAPYYCAVRTADGQVQQRVGSFELAPGRSSSGALRGQYTLVLDGGASRTGSFTLSEPTPALNGTRWVFVDPGKGLRCANTRVVSSRQSLGGVEQEISDISFEGCSDGVTMQCWSQRVLR